MTACVACETALRDYQENVSTGQTHGQTDARQSYPYVPLYASQATQKPQHLKKKKDCSSDLLDTPSSAGIYSVPKHCIYAW